MPVHSMSSLRLVILTSCEYMIRLRPYPDEKESRMPELSKESLENLEENRKLWSGRDNWKNDLKFGHKWGGANALRQTLDRYFFPFMPESALRILELAPGAGRFTAELLRLARSVDVVDINEDCLELCRERFSFYDNVGYFLTDGVDLSMLKGRKYELITSFGSFVHMWPEIVEGYLAQFPRLLTENGKVWLHHNESSLAKGYRNFLQHQDYRSLAGKYGLIVKAHIFLDPICQPHEHYRICITIMEKRPSGELPS